ncbi:MAG TPA: M12 family metallo-peptidase [Longimicrobium sp.]|nr:M12 family metallo-peptidase [Longimicrobium sp.]
MSAAAQENLLTVVPNIPLEKTQQARLAVIRGQASNKEIHLARIASAPARMLAKGAAVRLGVAPGVQVVADGERVEQRSASDISWAGPVRGAHGWVQMVLADGGMTATVTIGQTQYSIEPLGNGVHAISRIDQSGFPPEHPADNPTGALDAPPAADFLTAMAARGGNGNGGGGETGGETGGVQALSTINVLVVYTASAASRAGNITSKIQLAVDETNQSYVNSGISINMVRVHTAQVTYSETGRSFSQHVAALRSTTDGIMDNVHTLRNTDAADVVVLVVNDTEACGIASSIGSTATTAFAVADQSCITGYYSFGHEVGHLQGARHDRLVDGSTSPYAYGHGFIPSSKNWRTIMAYGNGCSNCTRIQWWSNPLKTYPSTGQVMGTAAYEDNARVLNLTAPTVAAYR